MLKGKKKKSRISDKVKHSYLPLVIKIASKFNHCRFCRNIEGKLKWLKTSYVYLILKVLTFVLCFYMKITLLFLVLGRHIPCILVQF